MLSRTKILLSILIVSGIALLVKIFDPLDIYRDWRARDQIEAQAKPAQLPEKERAIFNAIAKAEDISGPIERCRAIPMPSGVKWQQASIDAFCDDVNTPTIWFNELIYAIESGSGKLLDARFDRLIQAYFAGDISEGALKSAYYTNFDGSSAQKLRLIDQWLTASPNSPHALTMSGLVHLTAAYQYRGTKFTSETPKKQLDDMDREVKKSIQDLEKAIAINPKIFPAYIMIFDAARLISERDLIEQYYQKYQTVDPNNYYMLFSYAFAHQPKWGGSIEKQMEIIEQARKLSSVNPRMPALISEIKAEMSFEYKNNPQAQFLMLGEATAEGPLIDTIDRYARRCYDRGDYLRTYELYTQVLRFYPNNLDALYGRARAATSLQAYDYARKDIRTMLRYEPLHLDGLQYDAYLDLLENQVQSAQRKFEFVIKVNPTNPWAVEQLAYIAMFRTRDIVVARKMIDLGLALAPQNGSFHWLNWELVRRTDRKNLKEVTDDFIAHADKNDERQVEALKYTGNP
jgi:tetratricopeptide (TPR) repeat protein